MSYSNMGNHLGGLQVMLRQVFDEIGVHIINVNVSQEHQIMILDSMSGPTAQYMGDKPTLMHVHFRCNDKQLEYLKPFVNKVESRWEEGYSPVQVFNPSGHNQFADQDTSVIAIHDCVMDIHATGGSFEPFIEQFREQTSKLRYAIESKEFDQEVEKMLTNKGEYNN